MGEEETVKMTINAEIPSRVADIVRDLLTERFRDEFVFDPIIVEPEVDHDGDEYLKIYVVFDGDQKNLDPGWTLGLSRRIRPELVEMGVPGVPGFSFVEKSEWEELFAGQYRES